MKIRISFEILDFHLDWLKCCKNIKNVNTEVLALRYSNIRLKLQDQIFENFYKISF